MELVSDNAVFHQRTSPSICLLFAISASCPPYAEPPFRCRFYHPNGCEILCVMGLFVSHKWVVAYHPFSAFLDQYWGFWGDADTQRHSSKLNVGSSNLLTRFSTTFAEDHTYGPTRRRSSAQRLFLARSSLRAPRRRHAPTNSATSTTTRLPPPQALEPGVRPPRRPLSLPRRLRLP